MWFRKAGTDGNVHADALSALRREVDDLASQLRITTRELADLDERFRRWRGRDAKRPDLAPPRDEPQRKLSLADFKASGRHFPGG
jgi:hypothetical protein